MINEETTGHRFQSYEVNQTCEDHETILKLNRNASKWYTGGSKTADGTGIGTYGPSSKYSESLRKYPSILQLEIHAVRRHVQFNVHRNYQK